MAVIRALLFAEEITRNGARDAAREELSKGKYQAERPSLVQQLIDKALELLNQGIDRASQVVPGGPVGLIILALVLVAAIVVIRLRTGPLARSSKVTNPFGGFDPALSPGEHRRRADEHAAAGRYHEAVRERLRGIVRDLEDRALIEPRLGRTADEFAYEAGALLPAVAIDLRRAARTFDDIWYGGRPATAAMADDLRSTDRRVQAARLAPATTQPAQLAVPR